MKKLLVILSLVLALSVLLCGCELGSTDDGGDKTSSEHTSSVVSTGDTSSTESQAPAETRVTFYNFSMVLPEGYTYEDASGIYVIYNPEYPTHADNINITHVAIADDPSIYTEDVLNSTFSQLFGDGFEGIDGVINSTLDGLPFLVFSYTATVQGVEMTLTQCVLFGSNWTDTITFTQLDETFDDDFGTIFQSLKVAK